MTDSMVDVIGLPDFFVDGFTNYAVVDGILRCTAYQKRVVGDVIEMVPIFNLLITPTGAIEARAKAFDALTILSAMPDQTITYLRKVN